MGGMEKHRLEHDEGPDVVFEGEEIASVDDQFTGNGQANENNHFHQVTAYRTKGGKIIADVEYVTHWAGESGSNRILRYDSWEELADDIKGEEFPLGIELGREIAAVVPEFDKLFVEEID